MYGYDIRTVSLNVWHVSDNERRELQKSSYGQFHSDDVYIIRWRYKLITTSNNKMFERKIDTSRDRVIYWTWQGINATPNEKGISALMTIIFNEEKGPHVSEIFIVSIKKTKFIRFRFMLFKNMKKQHFYNYLMVY